MRIELLKRPVSCKSRLPGFWWRVVAFIFIYSLSSIIAFARPVVVKGRVIISSPVVYRNQNLDMSAGSFVVTGKGSLLLENCIINAVVSPQNPVLLDVQSGTLILENNQFLLRAADIKPDSLNPARFQAIRLAAGQAIIGQSRFRVDQPYTVTWLVAQNGKITLKNNLVEYFHGGSILSGVSGAVIEGNTFSHVSFGNLFIQHGSSSSITNNTFLYSGNGTVGDSIDLLDSDGVRVLNNYVASDFCYSIYLLRSRHITIDHNWITGGITYGIDIAPDISAASLNSEYLNKMVSVGPNTVAEYPSSEIVISNNYIAQNRYGLASTGVDGLVVKHNVFVQHFPDSKSRKFWTDNDVLLQKTIHITWENNLYKEAFTQEMQGDNSQSTVFVEFPLHGGVLLPGLNRVSWNHTHDVFS